MTGLVCGGSITLGHGVEPKEARYSDQLGVWLNDAYPLRSDEALAEEEQKQRHVVYNRGSHGADVRDKKNGSGTEKCVWWGRNSERDAACCTSVVLGK